MLLESFNCNTRGDAHDSGVTDCVLGSKTFLLHLKQSPDTKSDLSIANVPSLNQFYVPDYEPFMGTLNHRATYHNTAIR